MLNDRPLHQAGCRTKQRLEGYPGAYRYRKTRKSRGGIRSATGLRAAHTGCSPRWGTAGSHSGRCQGYTCHHLCSSARNLRTRFTCQQWGLWSLSLRVGDHAARQRVAHRDARGGRSRRVDHRPQAGRGPPPLLRKRGFRGQLACTWCYQGCRVQPGQAGVRWHTHSLTSIGEWGTPGGAEKVHQAC
jgi:hypothetical protein